MSEHIAELLTQLNSLLEGLNEWDRDFRLAHPSPMYWPLLSLPESSIENTGGLFTSSFQFSSIIMANTICHFWAFAILAISCSFTLRHKFAEAQAHLFNISELKNFESLKAVALEFGKNICQSVAYHLSPEMKVFGPPSIVFPLKTAAQLFKQQGIEHNQKKRWCEDQIWELSKNGVRFAAHAQYVTV
jgi:hypothetical protein